MNLDSDVLSDYDICGENGVVLKKATLVERNSAGDLTWVHYEAGCCVLFSNESVPIIVNPVEDAKLIPLRDLWRGGFTETP